jgi:hypothetical protein
MSGKHYRKWRNIILFLPTRYNARDHVDEETDSHLADGEWRTTDATISLWFLATITDDLQEIVMTTDNSAYATWQVVLGFFTENKARRSMHLRREFHDLR